MFSLKFFFFKNFFLSSKPLSLETILLISRQCIELHKKNILGEIFVHNTFSEGFYLFILGRFKPYNESMGRHVASFSHLFEVTVSFDNFFYHIYYWSDRKFWSWSSQYLLDFLLNTSSPTVKYQRIVHIYT